MTKKDYVLIAKAVKDSYDKFADLPRESEAIELVARRLAIVLAEENSRFDLVRFMDACGFESKD